MSENPYESPETVGSVQKSAVQTLVRWLLLGAFCMGAFFLVVAMMLPMHRGGGREASRRNQSLNNLKQISLAMHNYYDTHGTLPPAYTVDAEGNRLHSWRTLILPYMEDQALYESIDLTKPWDDPANAEARAAVVDAFVNPTSDLEETKTTYLAVVGPECAFAGEKPRVFDEFEDEVFGTIWVVEVSDDEAVHWMSPEDTGMKALLDRPADWSTNHPGVFLVGLADGHAITLADDTDRETLSAMLTIAGGEETSESEHGF